MNARPVPLHQAALLIVDMISDVGFPDGEKLRLAIAGVAGDACVLSSALDAHIRQFPVWVPANASASLTGQRNARGMEFLAESLGCDTHPVDPCEAC